MKRVLPLLFLLFFAERVFSQACTTLGQNPETAFPVCGTTVFNQDVVPICSSVNLYVPGCSGGQGAADYENKNPFWYKFTCYESGSLGFVINPNNSGDDYDWQLYDITGRNPTEVYTNRSLVVTGNWSGTFGATGARAGGVNYIQCASDPAENRPSFAAMPNIIQGHEYLLLVSHFTNSQSGYSLSFGGGTANITDPKLPKLDSASALCDGSVITIRLNKKMKCNSLTGAGNVEFFIEPNIATVVSATGNGCSNSFDMESVTLTMSNALPAGNYKVKIRDGADGNTLKDNCDRTIPVGDSIPLTIFPVFPTPMDSITKPGCAPQTLELVFSKPIRCNSVEPGGSDFRITGPYAVTVTSATGDCANGTSSKIYLQLSAPMQQAGNFQVNLVRGTDGNTIVDECGQETPLSSIPFSVKDTVNADFRYRILLGCVYDTVKYFHNGANGVNSWQWTFDDQPPSTLQNPIVYYTVFGTKETQLIVSNGTCSDTSKATVFLRNTLKAGFEGTEFVCPNDKAIFKDTSIGNIRNWSWDFGNGSNSNIKNPPPQTYTVSPSNVNYEVPVRLIVEDDIGCKDTAVSKVFIVWNCYIAVPSAFTPNGDGMNDNLYPLNAYKAMGLKFTVYNRLGQRVFYTENWTRKWNGKFRGQDADPGTYVWVLTYYNPDLRKMIEQKGSTVLIR